MRLWHYKLISYLPDKQLLAQWRELNSIFKKQDKHILINYIYEYPKENLMYYSILVLNEMASRKFKTKTDNLINYFDGIDFIKATKFNDEDNPFPNHHNARYLIQCFYNLQEKYDRGQNDFTKEIYERLDCFIMNESLGFKYGELNTI